ncbi:hypothetical protein H696_03856 [Fonticula alba]|uniref:SEC7 domain-containing protein n=1 Tax=Fonticula alba TaxID=691883 RepID=A0A058Z5P1_FONAL|nr:hypothetical protein H696_03856 [Fonticula alba]KCV69426.1 hypothetical protein H696_03856 [Fonticula alba]|eukprot:XP_009495991.1 hypothetical protein H696_03856 [Fonticula alba]
MSPEAGAAHHQPPAAPPPEGAEASFPNSSNTSSSSSTTAITAASVAIADPAGLPLPDSTPCSSMPDLTSSTITSTTATTTTTTTTTGSAPGSSPPQSFFHPGPGNLELTDSDSDEDGANCHEVLSDDESDPVSSTSSGQMAPSIPTTPSAVSIPLPDGDSSDHSSPDLPPLSPVTYLSDDTQVVGAPAMPVTSCPISIPRSPSDSPFRLRRHLSDDHSLFSDTSAEDILVPLASGDDCVGPLPGDSGGLMDDLFPSLDGMVSGDAEATTAITSTPAASVSVTATATGDVAGDAGVEAGPSPDSRSPHPPMEASSPGGAGGARARASSGILSGFSLRRSAGRFGSLTRGASTRTSVATTTDSAEASPTAPRSPTALDLPSAPAPASGEGDAPLKRASSSLGIMSTSLPVGGGGGGGAGGLSSPLSSSPVVTASPTLRSPGMHPLSPGLAHGGISRHAGTRTSISLLSPSSPISLLDSPDFEAAEAEQRLRRHWAIARSKFSADPLSAFDYLKDVGLIDGSALSIAQYLAGPENNFLNKEAIGEFLGGGDAFNVEVLSLFAGLQEFHSLSFDNALRQFLSTFRLPGEAQKIDRMMERFASRFHENNPGVFARSDTAYILAFSTIMLNTDLHNPAIRNKITKDAFIRNNRGIDNGADLPESFLTNLYDTILKEEIKLNDAASRERLTFFNPEREGYLWKQGGRVKTWKKRFFILTGNCVYYFKRQGDPRPCGIIPLENLRVCEAGQSRDKKTRFRFQLYHPDNPPAHLLAQQPKQQAQPSTRSGAVSPLPGESPLSPDAAPPASPSSGGPSSASSFPSSLSSFTSSLSSSLGFGSSSGPQSSPDLILLSPSRSNASTLGRYNSLLSVQPPSEQGPASPSAAPTPSPVVSPSGVASPIEHLPDCQVVRPIPPPDASEQGTSPSEQGTAPSEQGTAPSEQGTAPSGEQPAALVECPGCMAEVAAGPGCDESPLNASPSAGSSLDASGASSSLSLSQVGGIEPPTDVAPVASIPISGPVPQTPGAGPTQAPIVASSTGASATASPLASSTSSLLSVGLLSRTRSMSMTIKAAKHAGDGKMVEGHHSYYLLGCDSEDARHDWICSLNAHMQQIPIYILMRERREKVTGQVS